VRKITNKYVKILCFFLAIVILLMKGNLSQAQSWKSHSATVAEVKTLPLLDRRSTSFNNWQGEKLYLNQQKLAIPWIQWQEETRWHTGISDVAAMQILGLQLLDTDDPNLQPVLWFSQSSSQPIFLEARQIGSHRYLDFNKLISLADWKIQAQGDSLIVDAPTAKIENISHNQQSWGEEIIVSLDRPTFWKTIQTQKQGTITLEAIAEASAIENLEFRRQKVYPALRGTGGLSSASGDRRDDSVVSQASNIKNKNVAFSDEEPENKIETPDNPILPPLSVPNIESLGSSTKFSFDFSEGKRFRISTLTNPYRLAIEIRSDTFSERNILWYPGVRWRQQYVKIPSSQPTLLSLFPEDEAQKNQFPVTWLEIDLHSPYLAIEPIISLKDTLVGTAPLITTARDREAIVAINGGFFNRKTRMPLGAIRNKNFWLSSPILNRAAIGWNEKGDLKIDRLTLIETLTTSSGENLPVLYLNSGYTQPGISRYTKDWGKSYTPLTNGETIVLVQGDRIIKHLLGNNSESNSVPIPDDGYLLAIRGEDVPLESLAIGTQVRLTTNTVPQEFTKYPNILGAGPLLLQNRRIVLDGMAENFSVGFNRQFASRSAICINNRGKLIIATVRNRIGGSGPNLSELAQIMQRLGAVDAINLDGGSSTSLVLGGQLLDRSPSETARVHNGIGVFIKH
jgi:Phosphodiester glycosidase